MNTQPLVLRGSAHADREARAQHLANLFVGETVPLLVQVRQDFFDKHKDEEICHCRTFTEYCNRVLGYSESHIRRLIAGRNPATKKFDGSGNRKPEVRQDTRTNVQRLHDCGFVRRCQDPVLRALVLEQARCLDSADFEQLLMAATLEGRIVRHIWEEAERRRDDAQCAL